MTDVANTVISGLSNGGLYAFLALAYVIVFATSGVFNIAQAQIMILAGLVGHTLLVGQQWPWLAVAAVVAGVGGTIGYVEERFAVRPVRDTHGWILTTLGVAFLLQVAFARIWGTETLPVPGPISASPVRVSGIRFVPSSILVIVTVLVIAVLVEAVTRRTRFGRAWKATAQDRISASVLGVDVNRMIAGSFVVAGAIGAIGGLMVAPVNYVEAFGGEVIAFKGFLAVAIGGMTSISGAVMGGLLFGVIEAFSVRFFGANFFMVPVFLGVLVLLWIRPHGFFGQQQQAREV